MEFRNYTSLPSLPFESRGKDRRPHQVVVVKGTFTLPRTADRLRPHPDPEPLVMADQYHGRPESSSVRVESDLAPFKPGTDVHIIGDACAPGGRAATHWYVSVAVGLLRQHLRVTGP